MKFFVIHAALKQGLSKATQVIALADGANNCWSVLKDIPKYCDRMVCMLDWFHIGMKFQNLKSALTESYEDDLERVKWTLWHGKAKEALGKLALIQESMTGDEKQKKVNTLYNFLNRNQQYIVNYEQRKQASLTFTSQVAEHILSY